MAKIGWFCTYVPEELIDAAGLLPYRILPEKVGGTKDKFLPPNFCPYVRNLVEELENIQNDFESIVVTNSCNAMEQLYNVIKENFNLDIFLLNVPKKDNQIARKFFVNELKRFKAFLEKKGHKITSEDIINSINKYQSTINNLEKYWQDLDLVFPLSLASDYSNNIFDFFQDLYHKERGFFNENLKKNSFENTNILNKGIEKEKIELILFNGALPSRSLMRLIKDEIPYPVIMENCLSSRYFRSKILNISYDEYSRANEDKIIDKLANTYLAKSPCPKIFSSQQEKINIYKKIFNSFKIKAVIYHELSFCDYSNYDYLRLKNIISREIFNNNDKGKVPPFLKINTELEEQESGQFKTRLNAFMEMLT